MEAFVLCDRCRAVQDLELLLDDRPPNSKGYTSYNRQLQLFTFDDHWPEFPQLTKSARSGCCLCRLLLRKLPSSKARFPELQRARTAVEVQFDRTASRQDQRPRIIYSYQALVYSKAKLPDDTVLLTSTFFLACSAVPELPFYRAPSREVFCERTINFARRTIDHCTFHCHHTVASTADFMPTRLLDMNDAATTGKIRLVRTADMSCARYAALSYCWGNADDAARQSTTTSANLADRMRGSDLKYLSPVARDAVKVCAELGIRYLWIDALCILQGKEDIHDWEAESVKMVDIYRNAYLTLCIAGTTSCQDSFLAPRIIEDGLFIPLPVFEADQATGKSGRGYEIVPFHDIAHPTSPGFFSRLITDSQWFHRGWVWQEMNFSSRLLIFGQDLVFFECADSQQCENGDVQQYSGETVNRVGSPSQEILHGEPFHFFQMGVTAFSQKELSFESDRLVAVSGLAKEIAHRTESDYVAGLWANNLYKDLLFSRKRRGSTLERSEWLLGLQRSGPSWSWPAHPGGVEWPSALWTKFRGREDSWKLECQDQLSIETVPAGSSPFGQILTGVLNIHTKVSSLSDLAAQIRDTDALLSDADRKKISLIAKMLNAYSAELTRVASFTFSWDTNNPESGLKQPKKMVKLADENLLVLISSSHFPRSENRDAYGLIVQRAESHGSYVRVGVFHSEAPSSRFKMGYTGGLPVVQEWEAMAVSII